MPKPTEHDEALAEAVIRLKMSDAGAVRECMKTVVDGEAPNLADAMIERRLITREAADELLKETGAAEALRRHGPVDEAPPCIDGYELLQELGEGGMGTVWKARQTSLDRLVAIKVLPPVFSEQQKFIERFRREALATAKLNHPNIVSAIDVGTVHREGRPDLYYFVMEFVDGESVENLLTREKRIDPRRAIDIASDVARALDHAWKEAGIIHRDIKPGNILITRKGEVRVADLGLARSASEGARLTTAGLAIGTPHYASPEQAMGKADIDTRSDIYALGATLFEMLAGRTVYVGQTGAGVMLQHVNDDAPSVREFNPQVSPALAAVVAKMLYRDPDERYQTPAELIEELDRLRHGERPRAYGGEAEKFDDTTTQFGLQPPEVFSTRSVAAAQEEARPRPRQWPHFLLAGLFLAAVAVGVWYLVENRAASPGNGGTNGKNGGVTPVVKYDNRITLSFQLSEPAAMVGSGSRFPDGLTGRTGVRCYVRPEKPAFVCLVMVSSDGPGGTVKLALLAPSSDAAGGQLTHTMTPLPDASAFYPLAGSGATVAFIAVATPKPADRSALADSLSRIAADLAASGRNVLPRLPAGRTLWYDAEKDVWPAGPDAAATARVRAVLDALSGKLRGMFENNTAALAGAALSCSAD